MTFFKYTQEIIAIVAVIVWLIRLEGRVSYVDRLLIEAQKDVDVLRTKLELLDSKIVIELSEVKIILARLEERIVKKGGH